MTRLLAALSLAALALLTGCGDDEQSGGPANPDNQIEQPPLPGESASPGE